eukprot:scaffold255313_cov28-Tisochrysis_lutea.AAC.2
MPTAAPASFFLQRVPFERFRKNNLVSCPLQLLRARGDANPGEDGKPRTCRPFVGLHLIGDVPSSSTRTDST